MRTNHPRVRLLAVVLSLSALIAAAGPAQASSPPPVKVNVVDCIFGGGTATVDAGVPFLLDAGWTGTSFWHEVEFLLSQRTVAAIDGVAIKHANLYWGFPKKSDLYPPFTWLVFWDYPVKGLAHEHSITVTYDWNLRFPVFDGVDHYAAGPVLEPFGFGTTCVITAN
jgi:hypothetical protein